MKLVIRLYAFLLRLYPRTFRDEFAGEMQDVLFDTLAGAAQRGNIVLLQTCLQELLDLPGAILREHWARVQKGNIAMNPTVAFDDHPISWLETSIGLLPFLLFGPVMIWLAYPFPLPAESFASWFFQNRAVLFAASFLIGLILGWLSNWQRWSFSYLGLGVMILLGEKYQVGILWLVTLAAITLVVAFLLIWGRRSLQSLSSQMRRDWTPLSFGLSIVAALAFCGIDHEEDPNLTLLVILPGVVVFLTALVYLRSRNKRERIGSLVLGIALLIVVSTVRHWFFVLYGIVFGAIVFLPALFDLLPRGTPIASTK